MAHGGSYGGGSRNLIIELNIHNCRDKNIDHFRANRKTVYPDVTGTLCASCAGLNRPAGQGRGMKQICAFVLREIRSAEKHRMEVTEQGIKRMFVIH